jgi:CBS domain-containing protein
MRVDEVMSEDPVWVDFQATIGEAIVRLTESRVHHLPVLRDGVVIGIISDRDLCGAAPAASRAASTAGTGGLDEAVTTVMSERVVSVPPDADLKDVADLMIEHHIGAVPVVDPEGSKLAGIVSYVDVLRVARDALWG